MIEEVSQTNLSLRALSTTDQVYLYNKKTSEIFSISYMCKNENNEFVFSDGYVISLSGEVLHNNVKNRDLRVFFRISEIFRERSRKEAIEAIETKMKNMETNELLGLVQLVFIRKDFSQLKTEISNYIKRKGVIEFSRDELMERFDLNDIEFFSVIFQLLSDGVVGYSGNAFDSYTVLAS